MFTFDRNRQRFAVILAALSGSVDAIGFQASGGYFVAFMSGNTTRLGVALGTVPQLALTPALLIAGFVLGVTAGSLLATAAGRWRKPAVMTLVACLLLAGAGARASGSEPAMLSALVLAMGAINNTFQRDGEVAIGLTYITGALVKFGQGLAQRVTGRRAPGWSASATLWCALLTGAIVGACLEACLPFDSLWLTATWAVFMIPLALRLPVPVGGVDEAA